MAVYTTLTETEVSNLLTRFDLPELLSFQGVSSGIENSTYFLTLASGDQYVLTVFETLSAQLLAPYIQLIVELKNHSLPVPSPLIDTDGGALQIIANKPALLFPRAPGNHPLRPDLKICGQIAGILAQIHRVTSGPDFEALSFSNPHNLSWMKDTLVFVSKLLAPTDIRLLQAQIDCYADIQRRNLPQGIIHGDLFRDNVLVENGHVAAVIDFYSASHDILLIDLAVTANDWCYIQNKKDDARSKVSALLSGYRSYRGLNDLEMSSWHECLQVAAARLWLARLKRVVLSEKGGSGLIKDPNDYKMLLLEHLNLAISPL